MNKFIFIILLLILFPTYVFAGSENKTVQTTYRISHLAYRASNIFYGVNDWMAWNNGETKMMLYEATDFTHPLYAVTGRGHVYGAISDFESYTDLADYQSKIKAIPDEVHVTRSTGCIWSKITGEENILYCAFYSGDDCNLKKLDTSAGSPSWSSVVSFGYCRVACASGLCINYTLLGWDSNNKLIGAFNYYNLYSGVSGVLGHTINVQDGTKTDILSWPTNCGSPNCVVNYPDVTNHGHGAKFGTKSVDRCDTTSETNWCITDLNTCGYTLQDTGDANATCTHFSWKSDADWALCSSTTNYGYSSPGLYDATVKQGYTASVDFNTLITRSTARMWSGYNWGALPLATLSRSGTYILYTSTDGKYSYDDYSLQGKTPWGTEGYFLAVLTNAGSDTENPTLPSPEGFTATKNATNPTSQIDLAWSACTDNVGVTNYKIYRCTCSDADCDPTCSPTIEITSLAATSFYDNTGISPNTAYMYGVKCYDATGNNSTYTTTPWAKTDALASSDYTFLKKPSNITITIDGIMMPEEWGTANGLTITATAGGNILKVYGLWDSTYLYLGMFIDDESQKVLSSSTQNDDDQWAWNSIEVLISMNSGTGGTSDPDSPYMTSNDFHWIVDTNGYIWDGQGDDGDPTNPTSAWDCTTCTIAKTIYDDRDTVELQIPWSEIGTAPSNGGTKTMSFAINDFDWYTVITNPDGTTYQQKTLYWYMWGGYTNAFENESKWKTVTFSGTYASVMGKMTLSESGTGSISW